jgi:spore germination cell wall hydrolase CwlJ-like protein
MKIIITENQYNYLIENINPCPEGKKEDSLITLDDIKNGKTISKGYCNANSDSAIVKIQKLLQDKGYLDTQSNNGYYGDKTQRAVQKLWSPTTVEGTKIGKKTLDKLETGSNKPKEDKTTTKTTTDKETAENLFNELSTTQKILVCTLIGEAGGESDAYNGMLAVANVLQNRADANHGNYGSTAKEQALANKQFSMWNKYNSSSETLQNVYDKYKKHKEMENAISIVKNIGVNEDNTKGARFYYANYVSPDWSKDKKDTTFVRTATIGKHIFGNVVKKKKKK